jgi:hypothetical protein
MRRKYHVVLLVMLGLSINVMHSGDAIGQQPGLVDSIRIATADFERRLAKDHQDWEYSAYVSNVRNYGVGFAESDKYYIVVFRLKPARKKIVGGGGMYWVSKHGMKIIKFSGYE